MFEVSKAVRRVLSKIPDAQPHSRGIFTKDELIYLASVTDADPDFVKQICVHHHGLFGSSNRSWAEGREREKSWLRSAIEQSQTAIDQRADPGAKKGPLKSLALGLVILSRQRERRS